MIEQDIESKPAPFTLKNNRRSADKVIVAAWNVMALETELDTYKAKLPELLADEGKFVLIQGPDVVDTFATYEDAVKEGYARFGLKPFLVKQIRSIDQIHFISRLVPCLTLPVK